MAYRAFLQSLGIGAIRLAWALGVDSLMMGFMVVNLHSLACERSKQPHDILAAFVESSMTDSAFPDRLELNLHVPNAQGDAHADEPEGADRNPSVLGSGPSFESNGRLRRKRYQLAIYQHLPKV